MKLRSVATPRRVASWPETEVLKRPRFGRDQVESRHNSVIAEVKRLTSRRTFSRLPACVCVAVDVILLHNLQNVPSSFGAASRPSCIGVVRNVGKARYRRYLPESDDQSRRWRNVGPTGRSRRQVSDLPVLSWSLVTLLSPAVSRLQRGKGGA